MKRKTAYEFSACLVGSEICIRGSYPPYPADERAFLATILEFVSDAVEGRVEGAVDWLRTRRRQLDAGELSYVAHGYDVLYRVPG